MVSAKEALEIATKNQGEQMVKIYKNIEGQASIGRRRVSTDSYLTEDQQKELKDAGYTLTELTISQCHLIEW